MNEATSVLIAIPAVRAERVQPKSSDIGFKNTLNVNP